MNAQENEEWIFLWTRGHDCKRYFLHRTKRRLSVCDMSGDNPSLAEDGPLYLDRNRRAALLSLGRDIWAHLPVEGEGGKKSICSVHIQDLLWLIKSGFWDPRDVELGDDSLQDLYELFSLKVKHVSTSTETLRSASGDYLRSDRRSFAQDEPPG